MEHPGAAGDALSRDLDAAFARETRRGVLRAAVARGLLFTLLLANELGNLVWREQAPAAWVRDVALMIELGTAVTAAINYVLAARSPRPLVWSYVFMVVDLLIFCELGFAWFWHPDIGDLPDYLNLRNEEVVQLTVFLGVYLLPLSSRLTLSAGLGGIAIWIVGDVLAFENHHGGTIYTGPLGAALGPGGLVRIMDPNVLILDYGVIEVLLLGVFIGLLAWSNIEGRRFVISRVRAEADADFLGRLFPPALAARVAAAEGGRIAPARRGVAVLFADLAQEAAGAADDLAAMSAYFAAVEAVVFAHGGVLDRFTGGPVMATFGALEDDRQAADKALACARALLAAPLRPTHVALNAGPAFCGETGGDRTRVFSVVGDVVNAARRCLDAAAEAGARIVATEAFRRDLTDDADWPARARDLGEATLRGHAATVRLWDLPA
jgi:adenylate cyclase